MSDETTAGSDMRDRVASVLDQIRPYIQADGGDLELVNVDEATGVVSIRL